VKLFLEEDAATSPTLRVLGISPYRQASDIRG